jgi:hypothetical protein
MVCNQIPYANEQGIFKRVSGKIFQGTGIFGWSPTSDGRKNLISSHQSFLGWGFRESNLMKPPKGSRSEPNLTLIATLSRLRPASASRIRTHCGQRHRNRKAYLTSRHFGSKCFFNPAQQSM